MEEERSTKKKRRTLAKERKKREQEAKRMRVRLRKLAIWIISFIVLSFLGTRVTNWIKSPQPEIAARAVEVRKSDWIKGKGPYVNPVVFLRW